MLLDFGFYWRSTVVVYVLMDFLDVFKYYVLRNLKIYFL